MTFFATASANQNDLVQREALKAGATDIILSSGGVEFEADLETAYRFALTTRCSTRFLVLVHRYDQLQSTDDLYEHSLLLPWEKWLNPEMTFAITETVSDCRWITNSHFASLRLKDAIVERMRQNFDGIRPSVDRDNPDIVFHLHVNKSLVSWYVDFAGRDLSHRGYRTAQTDAVMSEFMSSSLLCRSDWYRILQSSFEDPSVKVPMLLDPFCGSGTILTEAALMATDTAPGLVHTERFAFFDLPIHNSEICNKVIRELEARVCPCKCRIEGWDIDEKAIKIARANTKAAGLENIISYSIHDFTKTTREDVESLQEESGCIVTDPPYGIRLASQNMPVAKLYALMGQVFFESFGGWNITLLCGEKNLLGNIEMKPNRTNALINGGIECQAAHYYVFNDEERKAMTERAEEKRRARLETPLTPGAQMAANRLKKNMDSIGKEMAKQGVSCYRLYDADMPEYSAAIDVYENRWISLQEYAAPSTIKEEDSSRRLEELINATERTTGIALENIYVKRRQIQKGANQYTKRGSLSASHFFIVNENGHRFIVNFADYLDTGLFLDHRPVRKMIEQMAEGKRFLNLFCYTASATVYAAAGGALSTVSVDSNANYLDWGIKNMQLNKLDTMNNFFYKEDCISYLKGTHDVFDLIFCDPPTFSNSKSRDTFDVQRDHGFLIRSCMKHLSKDGQLIFSTNYTKFKMYEELFDEFNLKEISEQTIGTDFARNSKIHRCWIITHKTMAPVQKTISRFTKRATRKNSL